MKAKSAFWVISYMFVQGLGCFSILQAQELRPDSTQLRAFETFNSQYGYQVYWSPKTGTPEAIFGAVTKQARVTDAVEQQPEKLARRFLKNQTAIFKMKQDLEDLEISRIRSVRGITHVDFQQKYQGVPIVGAKYFLHIDEADKSVPMVNGYYYSKIIIENKPDNTTTPNIEAGVAIEHALNSVEIVKNDLDKRNLV